MSITGWLPRSAARKLHAELGASLGPARFSWANGESGVIVTDDEVILHGRNTESIRRIPVRDISEVTLRRGWWKTLLEHFLTIEYDDGGAHASEPLSMPRTRAEAAAIAIADAAGAGREPRFVIEPVITPRLIAGLLFSGLFVFALGTLRTYFKYDASFVETMKVTAMLAAVIMIVVSMFAFWQ